MESVLEKFNLTDEQKRAIDIRKNIALSAGAGSGKTRVLSSRYMALLEAGVDMDSIAAITFTEKAALEMKERIRKFIGDMKVDESSFYTWQEHMDRLSSANICTIHSFCASIVRENAPILGIDWDFDIIDPVQEQLVLDTIWEGIMNEFIVQDRFKEAIIYMDERLKQGYVSSNYFRQDIMDIREKLGEQGKETIEALYKRSKDNILHFFILEVVKALDDTYTSYKLKNDVLDYNDLQRMCLELLQQEEIRIRYRARYRYLLVDEFQDINHIQKDIIYALVKDDDGTIYPGRLFVVGDFKQSIYGFRGTDYRIFNEVADDMGEGAKLSLDTCFRSKDEVIYGINALFAPLINGYIPMKTKSNRLSNDDATEKRIKLVLNPEKRPKTLAQKKLGAIKSASKGVEDRKLFKKMLWDFKETLDKVEYENPSGEAVAGSVNMLLEAGFDLKDIAILVRSRWQYDEIEQKLSQYGIPYCIIGGSGLYDRQEVREVLNIYELVIDRGYMDDANIPTLLSVLKGSFFNIPDDVLVNIAQNKAAHDDLSFWDALSLTIDNMKNNPNRARLKKAFMVMEDLGKRAKELNVVDILLYIMDRCNVVETLICHSDGLQKIRNMEKLLDRAYTFDQKWLFDQREFVEYIKVLSESGGEEEGALHTEDSQAVKLMTIHQSKGLEFEGVIIPGIDRDLLRVSSRMRGQEYIAFDGNELVFRSDDENTKKRYDTYCLKQNIKEIDESIRILYVAMTRAKSYVVLTGSMDDDCINIDDDLDRIKKLKSFSAMLSFALQKGDGEKWVEKIDYNLLPTVKESKTVDTTFEIKDLSDMEGRIGYIYSSIPMDYTSISRYMEFKECPRRFYLEKILGLNIQDFLPSCEDEISSTSECNTSPSIESSKRGSIVHKVLELSCSVDQVLKDMGYTDIAGLSSEIQRYVDNYREIENGNNVLGRPVIRRREMPFAYAPFDDGYLVINGVIDRLDVYRGEGGSLVAVITDYKTNVVNGDEDIKRIKNTYMPQLMVYGRAIEDLFRLDGKKVDDIYLKLYLLDIGSPVDMAYDREKAGAILRDIWKMYAQIHRSCDIMKFEKSTNVEYCKWCRYKAIC